MCTESLSGFRFQTTAPPWHSTVAPINNNSCLQVPGLRTHGSWWSLAGNAREIAQMNAHRKFHNLSAVLLSSSISLTSATHAQAPADIVLVPEILVTSRAR